MILGRAVLPAAATVMSIGMVLPAQAAQHSVAADVRAVSPPTSIASDCSADVSASLGSWLNGLPAGSAVDATGDCFQVDKGMKLNFPTNLTITGGTFENLSTSPPARHGRAAQRGFPVFNVLGGSGVVLRNLQIKGADPGGYLGAMAFAGAIELQGTSGASIDNVTVTSVFGDGVTLAPLRGGKNHNNGKIVAPTSDVSISDVTINGAGRMGITFGSVNGANVSNVSVSNVGLDTFDMEADQSNEGSLNVTIDGCTSASSANSNLARTFFSNGGVGSGSRTGDITVENCTMSEPQGTAPIQVLRPGTGSNARGPFLFLNDGFACGQSTGASLTACVVVSGSNVTVTDSSFSFPTIPPFEAAYAATSSSSLTFDADSMVGYGSEGTADATSTVSINGGNWAPSS